MAELPRDLPHLYMAGGGRSEPYTSQGSGRTPIPPERNREAHARALQAALTQAVTVGREQITNRDPAIATGTPGFYLQFELDPHDTTAVEKLENRQQKIEVVAVREPRLPDEPLSATVFVPERSAQYYLRRVEGYRTGETRSGRPKNEALVNRINTVHLGAVEALYTDEPALFPVGNRAIWWEVWLREGALAIFEQVAGHVEVRLKPNRLQFPEREIVLAYADRDMLGRVVVNSDTIAELRIAKDTPAGFLQMGAVEQAEWARDASARLRRPIPNNISVCVLDSGIARQHPMIEPALDQQDEHSYDPGWGAGDSDYWMGHGTRMSGIALYGDLQPVLLGNHEIVLGHRLETVKILPPGANDNDPALYGAITQESVARPEIRAPQRRRVFCMAVTSPIETTRGRPSSWSAALDQLSFGQNQRQRLFVVSAGNIRSDIYAVNYPNENEIRPVENPGQCWNGLTVGAYTEKTEVTDEDYRDWSPVAPAGDLSPRSRTSVAWERQWPIKPEIVLEGGNLIANRGPAVSIDDLELLTTDHRPNVQLFNTIANTSAATASAARMGAQVLADRPNFWPETIRALVVHSAEWTAPMRQYLGQDNSRNHKHSVLRRYGYGVPDLQRCLFSSRNDLTLIVEDQLHPFQKDGSRIKTRDMNLHQLPWPTEQLEALGDTAVQLRVTLSYFIEPNPGERGWTRKHRYASHGLRFEVKGSLENVASFRRRINKQAEAEDQGAELGQLVGGDSWFLGTIRNRGSIHSDFWSGTAAQLAGRAAVGVFPIGGWWREKTNLERWEQRVRYALIVSIRAPEAEIDIYTPVANAIAAQVQIEI